MNATNPEKTVSVIIPTMGYNKTISEAITSVLRNPVLEVIVVSRANIEVGSVIREGNVRVVVAPELNISQARNLGIKMSTSDIVAFTDDDCTVAENWVSSALTHFKDESIAVVGGPGLTDPNDSDLAKCAGAVLASFATFSCSSRYSKSRYTRSATERNLSTCNLFFRLSTLKQVGMFSSLQYPCEENDLIHRIQIAGHKVVYSPSCIVYHHRRPLLRPFLRQISFYGAGRAVFIVRRPRTFRPMFIGPSVMFLMTITIPLLYVFYLQGFLLVATLHILYFMLMLTGALRSALISKLRYRFVPIIFAGIVLMHYCYGFSFIRGLVKSAWRADS